MKAYCGLILIILILATTAAFSQDTLAFQKRNNENKTFDLPLNTFEIKLKPKEGRRKRVILTGYRDSVLTMKVWTFKGKKRKTKRSEIRDLYKDYPLKEGMNSTTVLKRFAIIDSLRQEIVFSGRDEMHINEIEKLIIYNGNNPNMKSVLKITEWSTLGWLLVGLPLFAVFPTVAYGVTWFALGVGIITFSIVTENKIIKLKNWRIKI